jgi:formylglycine-generating enzyme required for sulfatase activity
VIPVRPMQFGPMKPISFAPVHPLPRLVAVVRVRRFLKESGRFIFFGLRRSLFLIFISLVSFAISSPGQEVLIPDPNFNAVIREALQKPTGPLTQIDMLSLTNLGAVFRGITNVQGLEAARNLVSLDLQDNLIANFDFPTNLTKLMVLDLSENRFPRLTLPALTNLTTLRLESGRLTNLSLAPGLTKLTSLRVGFNQLSSLILPADMTNLTVLSAFQNQLTNLTFPLSLADLQTLNLDGNHLVRLDLPAGLAKLDFIALGGNQLTSLTIPPGMTNLTALRVNNNQLTNLTLAADLNRLSLLVVSDNELRSLDLPSGLASLTILDVSSNQLPALTLPFDMTDLSTLFLAGNSLTTFVLSKSLADGNLAGAATTLRNEGVSVFTYPLEVTVASPRRNETGAFEFVFNGPPGNYGILSSTNLRGWSNLATLTNQLGSAVFTDGQASNSVQNFYRALRQSPPTNMVFVPPTTFMMGSPTNDLDRSIFEGPQATVTLTHGFWMGKFEVSQGEYLAVTGENPSDLPGDLSRPISSVTWSDATNYCRMLTQRELAAGRIAVGSEYRLPTEAEWECGARAGTTTRFTYGDDVPNYMSLTNYAWFLDLGHPDLTVHPVGLKLPNPWGFYDMAGNVWEWCQDWYSDQTGGVQTDPTGPAANANENKVIRGGAYDYPNSSCRSGSRLFHFALSPDSDVGFRVVLAAEQR